MCDVLDRIEHRGWQNGWQSGWQKGGIEREAQIILNLYQNKAPLELIAASVGKTVDEVKDIVAKQKSLLS